MPETAHFYGVRAKRCDEASGMEPVERPAEVARSEVLIRTLDLLDHSRVTFCPFEAQLRVMKELTELNESSFQSELSESGKALPERGDVYRSSC